MSKWYYRDGSLACDMSNPGWEKGMKDINSKLGESEYKIVKQEELENGFYVSTVWIGLDHAFMGGKPLIFETMVFKRKGNFDEQDVERYSTEEEAIEGHKKMVEKWSKI